MFDYGQAGFCPFLPGQVRHQFWKKKDKRKKGDEKMKREKDKKKKKKKKNVIFSKMFGFYHFRRTICKFIRKVFYSFCYR